MHIRSLAAAAFAACQCLPDDSRRELYNLLMQQIEKDPQGVELINLLLL